MEAFLLIDGQMPDLNDWRSAIARNPHAGGRITRECARRAETAARVQLLPRFERPVSVTFLWTEANRRRDLDNIAGTGQKFVLDGLVAAGVLPDDGPDWVREIHHYADYDPMNVGVAVHITDEIRGRGAEHGA